VAGDHAVALEGDEALVDGPHEDHVLVERDAELVGEYPRVGRVDRGEGLHARHLSRKVRGRRQALRRVNPTAQAPEDR